MNTYGGQAYLWATRANGAAQTLTASMQQPVTILFTVTGAEEAEDHSEDKTSKAKTAAYCNYT